MRNTFNEFCQETSLHGWGFIVKRDLPSCHCVFWILTIFSALSLGIVLISWNTEEFINDTVDFNTLSMTTSLDEVFFPAIYVINKNFVRKSIYDAFFKDFESGM